MQSRPTEAYWTYLRAAWVRYNRNPKTEPHPLTWEQWEVENEAG